MDADKWSATEREKYGRCLARELANTLRGTNSGMANPVMRRCMACGRSVPETEIRKARECPALKLCEGCNSPSKRMLILARAMGVRR
jgi:hypothetical protein